MNTNKGAVSTQAHSMIPMRSYNQLSSSDYHLVAVTIPKRPISNTNVVNIVLLWRGRYFYMYVYVYIYVKMMMMIYIYI